MVIKRNIEKHRTDRIGWLRAAVLGANDGILSVASLVVGVSAAHAPRGVILVTGVAGLIAGAMSMAAGEYVSVSSQSDTERADLARERKELAEDHEGELQELASIYRGRGLDPALAVQVAQQLTAHDALAAHARDELGISHITSARPVQAALASAVSFSVGGVLPLFVALVTPGAWVISFVFGATLVFLAGFGAAGAFIGGAPMGRAIIRIVFWGAISMAVTAAVGGLFGVNV